MRKIIARLMAMCFLAVSLAAFGYPEALSSQKNASEPRTLHNSPACNR